MLHITAVARYVAGNTKGIIMASDNTKKKVIHCRLTEDEHKAIAQAAQDQGTTITKFVVKAALANENRL